ncbi:hypothetical protein BH24PSE2_BH24PSE2_04550 [soil metagenome]
MAGKNPMRRILDRASAPTTFISENASLNGDLEGSGHFVVCGTVIGNCRLTGSLTIAETGRWSGRIEAHDVVIAGRIDGDVSAAGKIEVAASAHIEGNLSGRSVAVADGAMIEGGINVQGDVPLITFKEKRGPESSSAS